jgi:hypothetical protein
MHTTARPGNRRWQRRPLNADLHRSASLREGRVACPPGAPGAFRSILR